MNSFLNRLSFVAFIWFVLLSSSAFAQVGSSREIIDQLFSLDVLTSRYDGYLKRFFQIAQDLEDIQREVNVSGTFVEGNINVFVVGASFDEKNSKLIPALGVRSDLVAKNVFAVNHDLIIVGERFLADLFLHSYNGASGLAISSVTLGAGTVTGDPVQYHQAMSTYLSLGNIWASELDPKDPYFIGDDQTQKHPISLFFPAADVMQQSTDVHYLPLLFVFLHEISHLSVASSGSVANLEDMFQGSYRLSRQSEEKRADEEALDQLFPALDRTVNGFLYYGVSGLAQYFRDTLLFRYFDEIDRWSPGERFVTFMHSSCDPDAARMRGFRRDTKELVVGGYLTPLPILSPAEQIETRARIKADLATSTHPHNFSRSQLVLKAIDKFLDPRSAPLPSEVVTLTPYLRMLRALENNEPYIRTNDITGVTGKSADEILEKLRKLTHIEESNVCDDTLRCLSGSNKGLRVEFIEQQGSAKFLRVFMPLQAIDGGLAEGEIEVRLKVLQKIVSVFGDLQKDAKPASETDEIIRNASSEIRSCGFHYSQHVLDQSVVEISTLIGADSMEVKVLPKTHNIFQLK